MKRKLTQDDCFDVQTNSILFLPDDMLGEIFKKVRPEIILSSFALVCKRFFVISQIDFLWQFKQAQHFPLTRPLSSQAKKQDKKRDQKNALTLFRERYKEAYMTKVKDDKGEAEKGDEYKAEDETRKEEKQNARLFSCVKEGDVESLKAAKVTLEDFVDKQDKYNRSLFKIVILNRHQGVLDYIYELARAQFMSESEDGQKVDVHKVDADGKTLLLWAAQTNQVDKINQLIEAGADLNQEDDYDDIPLLMAAENGHIEVVKLLLMKSPNPNQGDSWGETPLLRAAMNGHFEVVKLLLEKGADVNQGNSDNETSLLKASENGHLEAVKLLLENGADPNQGDDYAQTPLLKASENGHLEAVKLLLANSTNLDKVNYSSANLQKSKFKNLMIKIKPSYTLREGIILLEPNSATSFYSNLMVNISMIIALEKASQLLTQVRQDEKKASAICDLINLIYTNANKSFSEHVMAWKSQANSQDRDVTNQEVISMHSKSDSENDNAMNTSVIAQIGLFSEANSKVIEKEIKTEIEILIDDLVAHSQLWSGNLNLAENTASSSSMQTANSSRQ